MNMGFGINTKHRDRALTTPFKCIDTNSCGPCSESDEGTSWWKQPFFPQLLFFTRICTICKISTICHMAPLIRLRTRKKKKKKKAELYEWGCCYRKKHLLNCAVRLIYLLRWTVEQYQKKRFFFLMKIFFITYQLKHQYFNCFSLSLIYTILRNATLRSKWIPS